MNLGRLPSMVAGVLMMALSGVGVVGGLLVSAGFVALPGLPMVVGGMLVVLGSLDVMVSSFF